ncbi:hypothetical protein OK016_05010 [Vibrio chagasii]|nr:hypothetical protein [Vibrio chagasii]
MDIRDIEREPRASSRSGTGSAAAGARYRSDIRSPDEEDESPLGNRWR